MSQLPINYGAAANDGTGTNWRTAFQRIQDNFTDIYSLQSRIVNAGDVRFAGGATTEAKIQAAIDQASSELATAVFVPASMFPYDATAITFNDAIRMVREGGDFSVYDVLAYGADDTGTNAATAAFQAAHDGCPAVGSRIAVPPGLYLLGTVSITKPVTIAGAGRRATRIRAVAATGDIFDVQTFEPIAIRDMAIGTSVTRTAGSAIRLRGDSGGGSATGNNRYSHFFNLSINNQYVGIDFEAAYGWTMDHCYVVDNVHTGARVNNTATPDAGDSTIAHCTFDAVQTTPVYGIHQLASGGLRIVNNKILNHDYGYYMELDGSVNTSILEIVGNSWERSTVAAIAFERVSGSEDWQHLVIAANQHAQCPVFVQILTTGSPFSSFAFTGNVIQLPVAGGTAFQLVGGAQGYIGSNTITGQGGTSIGVDLQAGTTGVVVGPNTYNNLSVKFQDAGTSNGVSQLPYLVLGNTDVAGNARLRIDGAIATTNSGGNITAGHTSGGARVTAVGGDSTAAEGFLAQDTIANNTIKRGRFKGAHYANAEEPVTGLIIRSDTTTANNQLFVGGGSSAENAVNEVKIYSATNNNTVTGTEVARFDFSTTAGQTRFMLYDVDNGTLERVTVGAADSGGVGFKVLRIPN